MMSWIRAKREVINAVEKAMESVPKGIHYAERLACVAIEAYEAAKAPDTQQPIELSPTDEEITQFLSHMPIPCAIDEWKSRSEQEPQQADAMPWPNCPHCHFVAGAVERFRGKARFYCSKCGNKWAISEQEPQQPVDCREAFEEWSHKRCGLKPKPFNGKYTNGITQMAWEGWQAGWGEGYKSGCEITARLFPLPKRESVALEAIKKIKLLLAFDTAGRHPQPDRLWEEIEQVCCKVLNEEQGRRG